MRRASNQSLDLHKKGRQRQSASISGNIIIPNAATTTTATTITSSSSSNTNSGVNPVNYFSSPSPPPPPPESDLSPITTTSNSMPLSAITLSKQLENQSSKSQQIRPISQSQQQHHAATSTSIHMGSMSSAASKEADSNTTSSLRKRCCSKEFFTCIALSSVVIGLPVAIIIVLINLPRLSSRRDTRQQHYILLAFGFPFSLVLVVSIVYAIVRLVERIRKGPDHSKHYKSRISWRRFSRRLRGLHNHNHHHPHHHHHHHYPHSCNRNGGGGRRHSPYCAQAVESSVVGRLSMVSSSNHRPYSERSSCVVDDDLEDQYSECNSENSFESPKLTSLDTEPKLYSLVTQILTAQQQQQQQQQQQNHFSTTARSSLSPDNLSVHRPSLITTDCHVPSAPSAAVHPAASYVGCVNKVDTHPYQSSSAYPIHANIMHHQNESPPPPLHHSSKCQYSTISNIEQQQQQAHHPYHHS